MTPEGKLFHRIWPFIQKYSTILQGLCQADTIILSVICGSSRRSNVFFVENVKKRLATGVSARCGLRIRRFALFAWNSPSFKGFLHLWDGGGMRKRADLVHGAGLRTKPINTQMTQKLCEIMRKYVENVKNPPFRAAYALDDEVSWGHFVHPSMWRIADDYRAYTRWLKGRSERRKFKEVGKWCNAFKKRELWKLFRQNTHKNKKLRDCSADWITCDSIWAKLE